jgi:hypothetical protein
VGTGTKVLKRREESNIRSMESSNEAPSDASYSSPSQAEAMHISYLDPEDEIDNNEKPKGFKQKFGGLKSLVIPSSTCIESTAAPMTLTRTPKSGFGTLFNSSLKLLQRAED